MKKTLVSLFVLSVCLAAHGQTFDIGGDAFAAVDGVRVGNCQNDKAKTGVTVFYFPQGAFAAVDVLGGGPASRETELASPERNVHPINALVFSGGSSYGLEAAQGVMECLEKNGVGYDTGYALVPLVCQSDIFDLSYGRSDVRPDSRMGYKACKAALEGNAPCSGNIGAGTGATVGKPLGMLRSQKSGIGYSVARLGNLVVAVAAVVNAYGDIYYKGQKIAGMTTEDRSAFADASRALYSLQPSDLLTGNTSLIAVFTNADFTPIMLKKVANMASAGMARAINPVFTMADGDTVYALSVGSEKVASDVNVVGTLAAEAIEEAIRDAVLSSRIPEEEYLSNIK